MYNLIRHNVGAENTLSCYARNIINSFRIQMLRVTGVLLGSCGHCCLPLLEEVSYHQSLSQSHSQCPALGPQSPAGPLEPCLPARPAPALQLLSGAEPSAVRQVKLRRTQSKLLQIPCEVLTARD